MNTTDVLKPNPAIGSDNIDLTSAAALPKTDSSPPPYDQDSEDHRPTPPHSRKTDSSINNPGAPELMGPGLPMAQHEPLLSDETGAEDTKWDRFTSWLNKLDDMIDAYQIRNPAFMGSLIAYFNPTAKIDNRLNPDRLKTQVIAGVVAVGAVLGASVSLGHTTEDESSYTSVVPQSLIEEPFLLPYLDTDPNIVIATPLP